MSQITKLGLRGESRNLTLDSTLRDWTHVPPESPEAMPKNMQDLICEFKTLYEEKIKRLDLETSATPEEKLQVSPANVISWKKVCLCCAVRKPDMLQR